MPHAGAEDVSNAARDTPRSRFLDQIRRWREWFTVSAGRVLERQPDAASVTLDATARGLAALRR